MASAPPSITDEGKSDRVVAQKKPSLHSMVLEALAGNKEKKGMTIQGIKKTVIKQYPDTQENFSNKRLQNALKKGLDSCELIRPKSSEEQGFKGYFLLNRALAAQKEKEKKKKEVVKTAAAKRGDDTEKSKKQVKAKAAAKTEQSKPTKGRKSSAKTTKAVTTKETSIKSKVARKKQPLEAKSSNASTKSTPKTPKRRLSIATPKLSRADRTKAGVCATKGRRVK